MTDNKDAMHQKPIESASNEKTEQDLRNIHIEHAGEPGFESDALNCPEGKAAERRIVRKLDMTLLPMVWILYMFNYLDRNNIACVPTPSVEPRQPSTKAKEI
jgi:hypothetical protein